MHRSSAARFFQKLTWLSSGELNDAKSVLLVFKLSPRELGC